MEQMLLNILVIAALIALDQITKYLATLYLAPVGVMPFIPGVMELQYYLNDGAAFSILSGVAGGQVILLVVTGVVLVGMVIYLFWKKPADRLQRAALLLIISGGLGNFIDRALNSVVVDFFSPTFINFAVFNMADVFVCVGVGLLFLSVILDEVKNRRVRSAGAEGADAGPETEAASAQPQANAEVAGGQPGGEESPDGRP